MRLTLRTVKPQRETQPENRDTTRYVRKHWSIFVVYYVATSVALGVGMAAAMALFLALDPSRHGNRKPIPVHGVLIFSIGTLGVVSAITFLIQLISGPFVFTKDVVCRKCHMRLQVERIAFFTGRYSRPPRCECGGKIEPAFLWKPDVHRCNPSGSGWA